MICMIEKIYPMTQQGKDKLEEELEDLKVNKSFFYLKRISIIKIYFKKEKNELRTNQRNGKH